MSWCLEIAWNTDLEDQQNFISLSWLSWHSCVFFLKLHFTFCTAQWKKTENILRSFSSFATHSG